MITLRSIILIVTLVIMLVGCEQRPKLPPAEYAQWVENPENGFVKQKTFDAVSFISFYKPSEYRVLKEVVNTSEVNLDSIKNEIDLSSQWYTFTFRVKAGQHPLEEGNQSTREYFQKLEYYINAQPDFKLIVDKTDTLECTMYHMERNYGGAPYIDINVAFKNENQTQSEITMLYFDRIFSNGTLKFNYQIDETTSLPQYVL